MNHPDVERLFHEALALPSAEERAAFLAGACGHDPVLRAQVEALVESHERFGADQSPVLRLARVGHQMRGWPSDLDPKLPRCRHSL